ncbi:MAG: gliding motility-associated C-terminal domain-containing protein [Cytophagales bacterium]|nr:gliding motility-associated C-terminal domain-containing protein [Cytophagales bacterium]
MLFLCGWTYLLGIPVGGGLRKQSSFKAPGFVENKGQWHASHMYRYGISSSAYLFVQEHGWYYHLMSPPSKVHAGHAADLPFSPKEHRIEEGSQGISFRFLGATNKLRPRGMYGSYGRHHFFLGKDPSRWGRKALSYQEIWYCDLYEGIDLQLFKSPQGIKYNLFVAPGGDLSKLSLKIEGAIPELRENLLSIPTRFGVWTEHIPKAYLIHGQDTLSISCKYVWKDKHILGFEVPDYDTEKYTLLIDPELVASTLTGSSADNWGNTACTDEGGNMYAGGIIFGASVGKFEPSSGIFPPGFQGYRYEIDVLISKFTPDGRELIFAVYLGGARKETPTSMQTNRKGELFVAGITSSSDFPTTKDAYDKSFAGGTPSDPFPLYLIRSNPRGPDVYSQTTLFRTGTDLFVAKISSDGANLLGSTYLGGTENDGLIPQGSNMSNNYGDGLRSEIDLDQDGDPILASHTYSHSDFPLTHKPLGSSIGTAASRYGSVTGVLVKLKSDLSGLIFSWLIGSRNGNMLNSVRANLQGFYVAGSTWTSTPLAFSYSLGYPLLRILGKPGSIESFVAFIPRDYNMRRPSPRLMIFGTDEIDQAYLLDLDSDGDVYVTGQTRGTGYPIKGQVFRHGTGGHFIHKFNHDLTRSIWSTVIGGNSAGIPQLVPTAFMVSDCEQIFLVGWGGESNRSSVGGIRLNNEPLYNLPITTGAYRRRTTGSDFYFLVLAPDASKLIYGSYFGSSASGDHVDGGTSRFEKSGIVYQAACANCGSDRAGFPTTSGAFAATDNSTNCNMGVFKFEVGLLKSEFDVYDERKSRIAVTTGCAPFVAVFDRKASRGGEFFWNFDTEGDGSFVLNNDEEVTHSFDSPGNYVITLKSTDPEGCNKEVLSSWILSIKKPLEYRLPEKEQKICFGEELTLEAYANSDKARYFWAPIETLSSPTGPSVLASPTQTTKYFLLIRAEECEIRSQIQVEVVPEVRLAWGPTSNPILSCQNAQTFEFQAEVQADHFHWDLGDGTSLKAYEQKKTISHVYEEPGPKHVVLHARNGHCEKQIEQEIHVQRLFIPNVFTPNGDGKNEKFVIDSPYSLSLLVLNKNGSVVFQQDNYDNSWEGSFLPSDVYFYQVFFSDYPVTCKGWVHLLK